MEAVLRGLNVAQKAAVTSSAAVLQVLAPPGSGKTKTLTSRVAYLLAHRGYAPWNVICCTFTIKSSREMRERLRGMIGAELESKLILGTFHSICRRYLVTYGHLIGIPKNFGIADSNDSLNIVKRAVRRLNLSLDPKTARSRISHRKARGKRLVDSTSSASSTLAAQEFATICHEYEDALTTSNLLDYDDLLIRCVELLEKHPQCVSNIEALLIDEFQDTNVVQFELMKLLASANKRVTIVGDPDQSIYGFRSADIENLRRMKDAYPDTEVINLEENYRSSTALLKLAQEVIEQDIDRPDKKLKSTHCYGTPPVLRRLPNPYEEAQWIVCEIQRITQMTGQLIKYDDIAILLRSAYLSLLVEKALANAGVPYRMVGGRRFFDRVEVRVLIDYLRTISHPDNNSALLAIINTPARKVGDATVEELVRMAEQKNKSLWTTLQEVLTSRITLPKKLSKPTERGLSEVVSLVKAARKKLDELEPGRAPQMLIEYVVQALKYEDFLRKQYPKDYEERLENVQELVTQAADAALRPVTQEESLPGVGVEQSAVNGAHESLSSFLANVVLSTEVETDGENQEISRITISTIHSAKGLEWPVVFVPAVYEGSMPHSRAEDTNEERRLLYVAMTRAQTLLYLTFPVLQTRDESESIMSQFLPGTIAPLVSEVGAVFNYTVVSDIAMILRRRPPSREVIEQGIRSLEEGKSQFDDLWPVDGSRRRQQVENSSDYLVSGTSIGTALTSAAPGHGQRSHYSTSSASTTTTTNAASFATANLSPGFSTASHHYRTMPQLPEQRSIKPSLIQATRDKRELVPAKAKQKPGLVKSSSSQSSMTNFLTRGSFAPQQNAITSTTALQKEIEAHTNHGSSNDVSLPAARANCSTGNIPSNLSGHKVSLHAHKRPASVLHETTASNLNQTKKRTYHGVFSSSPTSTDTDCYALPPDITHATYGAKAVANTSPAYGASSSLHTTTVSQLSTALTSCSALRGRAQEREPGLGPGLARMIGLNTLGGHQYPGAARPLNNLGQEMSSVHAGRSLGVKRSMNSGWENRKHR